MNESNTPRTDAHLELIDRTVESERSLRDFARQLETELNQWRAMAEDLANQIGCGCGGGYGYCNNCDSTLARYEALKGQTK